MSAKLQNLLDREKQRFTPLRLSNVRRKDIQSVAPKISPENLKPFSSLFHQDCLGQIIKMNLKTFKNMRAHKRLFYKQS